MNNKPLNILLLGGTGAIGTHLANTLLERGHTISITSRKYRKTRNCLNYIQGNAHDNSFLSKILAQHNYDVCVDFMSYTTQEFSRRIDLLLSSIKQYVYISSGRVYSNENEIITEKTPRLLDVSCDNEFLLTDEYALTKARQENILFNSKYANWTIIRPYITYSENRLQLGVMEKEQWLYRALNGRDIVFSNDIAQHYTTMTYGKDVASGIASICGNRQALGEIFNITTSESIQWIDVLKEYDRICKSHHLNIHFKLCPQSMYLNTNSQYQVKYDRYFDRKFDNSKISKFINTSNFVSVKQGLSLCLESFIKKPQFNHYDMRGEVIRDTITHQCANKEEFKSIKYYYIYLILRYLCPKFILQ